MIIKNKNYNKLFKTNKLKSSTDFGFFILLRASEKYFKSF